MSSLPTIVFYTLGCRLNQSESAVITNLFRREGYAIDPSGKAASIAVINTCTVTKNSDRDVKRLINKIIRINQKIKIALIGCQAQIQHDQLREWPNVRWVIGTEKKMELVSIIRGSEKNDVPVVDTSSITSGPFSVPETGMDANRTRANIKIQDGCNVFCAYCEVPYARGRARSRVFDDIIKEATSLAKAGHQEVILTGINLGDYSHKKKNLIDVIGALEDIPELSRIRISSIEPTEILDPLMKKMTKGDKLCRHLHIPVQSCNDKILKLMKRSYSYDRIHHWFSKASSLVHGICLGTDIIVGFPGEENADFQETYERIRALPVHHFHVFSYSDRIMAPSKGMGGKVSIKDIQERSRLLRELGQQKRESSYRSMIGSEAAVLFEQKKKGFWIGLTDNFMHVKVKSNKNLSNQMCTVKFLEVENLFAYGEIVE